MAFGDSYSAVQQAALADAAREQQARQFATAFAAQQLNNLRSGAQQDRAQGSLETYRNNELLSRYMLPGIANKYAMDQAKYNWDMRGKLAQDKAISDAMMESQARQADANMLNLIFRGIQGQADAQSEQVAKAEAERTSPGFIWRMLSSIFGAASGPAGAVRQAAAPSLGRKPEELSNALAEQMSAINRATEQKKIEEAINYGAGGGVNIGDDFTARPVPVYIPGVSGQAPPAAGAFAVPGDGFNGSPTVNRVGQPPAQFLKGQRVEQNGVVYEFDGKTFVPLD